MPSRLPALRRQGLTWTCQEPESAGALVTGRPGAWYRGGTTAPAPCVSALLAVEKWADHLIDDARVPVSTVVELMLRDCRNLAMPGLAAGVLVRHLEVAGSHLDRWLTRPELWQMEFGRSFGEHPGAMHIQGADPADLHGRARRGMDFGDVAAEMTVQATLDGDHERLAVLAAIGDELVRRSAELSRKMDLSRGARQQPAAVPSAEGGYGLAGQAAGAASGPGAGLRQRVTS